MSDSISRQQAIDALMAILDRPNHAEFLYTDEICKALERMPSAQSEQQRWIPTSKKLPESDERVLVYTAANEYHVWDAMPHRGKGYEWEDEEGLYHSLCEVEMWMPLPEAHAERSEE